MITDDTTFRPESQSGADSQILQRGEKVIERVEEPQAQMQAQMQMAQGLACPYCGTVNDPEAMFCASCGKPIRMGCCPNCGSEIDPEADFCEICHHYIRKDVCSFCGARFEESAAFCPECGNPRGGIVCPTCNTLNDFAFCKQCGTPLTDEAKMLSTVLRKEPEYLELVKMANEMQELDMSLPYNSERDIVLEKANNQLREHVLTLLANDRGVAHPVIPKKVSKRLTQEELNQRREEMEQKLNSLLEKMQQKPQPSPAKVRNYAMAQKPYGLRLAWECNFKHALHSSPCGCAKPQLGGKWVVLGKNNNQDIKDDK